MDQLGIGGRLRQYDVLTSWKSIVGDRIARVAVPEKVEKGILFVSVATGPWRAELTMKRMEIREKINAQMGSKVIKEIRFR